MVFSNAEMMPLAETRKEIDEGPETVARVLREQVPGLHEIGARLAEKGVRRIYLIGSGDSGFVGLCARLAFERYAGLSCEALQAFEYAAYGCPGLDEQSCAILISSSGRKSTTRDALDRALASGAYVVGLTDNPDEENPFISRVHRAVVPGARKLGWPTQTTLTTLAALFSLAIELGRFRGLLSDHAFSDLQSALVALSGQMREVLDQCRSTVRQLANRYKDAGCWTFIGSGPNFGAAWIGSALMAEGPQRVGLALSVEEFHHGLRAYTLTDNEPVFLITSNDTVLQRNLETCRVIHNRRAGLAILFDETSLSLGDLGEFVFQIPKVPEPFSPLLTILPLQELSIQLAAQRVEQGYRRPVAEIGA